MPCLRPPSAFFIPLSPDDVRVHVATGQLCSDHFYCSNFRPLNGIDVLELVQLSCDLATHGRAIAQPNYDSSKALKNWPSKCTAIVVYALAMGQILVRFSPEGKEYLRLATSDDFEAACQVTLAVNGVSLAADHDILDY